MLGKDPLIVLNFKFRKTNPDMFAETDKNIPKMIGRRCVFRLFCGEVAPPDSARHILAKISGCGSDFCIAFFMRQNKELQEELHEKESLARSWAVIKIHVGWVKEGMILPSYVGVLVIHYRL